MMKPGILLCLMIILFASNLLIAQQKDTADVEEIFMIVEDPAEPFGGYEAFYQYVADKLIYPEQARKMGVEGKVYVQFIVDESGALTEVKSVKGIGAGCDSVAVNVIANVPGWNPPMQKGKPVKQRIILPITFRLSASDRERLEGKEEEDSH